MAVRHQLGRVVALLERPVLVLGCGRLSTVSSASGSASSHSSGMAAADRTVVAVGGQPDFRLVERRKACS
jgi:hypothetical protein